MAFDSRHQQLVDLMEAYVSGAGRSQQHVSEMEGEFAKHLDDDERFENLQYALAMVGADGYDSEGDLERECIWALKTLDGVCVHAGCRASNVPGSRFCLEHGR